MDFNVYGLLFIPSAYFGFRSLLYLWEQIPFEWTYDKFMQALNFVACAVVLYCASQTQLLLFPILGTLVVVAQYFNWQKVATPLTKSTPQPQPQAQTYASSSPGTMSVRFNHREMPGGMMSGKTFQEVTVHVTFTQEQLAIIKKRKLERLVVMERKAPANRQETGDLYYLRVSDLVKGPNTYLVLNPLAAKIYEDELTDRLRALKTNLELNATTAESKTIEL